MAEKKHGKVKTNVKTRRGYKGKHNVHNNLKIIGVNANGISSKLESLNHIFMELKPSVICLQETKLRKMGKLKFNGYIVFESIRKNSQGGGLAIIVKSDLEPVWISEVDDQVEILIVEIHIEDLPIRIINCYGPQESDSVEKKSMFWSRLQLEINEAFEHDVGVIVQMDGNLHAGSNIVPNDPNPINSNGKLFKKFLKDCPSMYLINGTDKCQGTITRSRKKSNKVEEAILDYVLVSENLMPYLISMVIDEEREYPLTSYLKNKPVHSDHFTEIIDFEISYKKQKPVREEFFNFKSSEGLVAYKDILNSENNLTNCFNNENDLQSQVNNWCDELNKIFKRCFKKIRVSSKQKVTELSELQKKRSELLQNMKISPNDNTLKEELDDVVEKITKLVSEENRDRIMEQFEHLDQTDDNINMGIWKVKNKHFPKKTASVPSAKADINGRLVSDPNGLKNLYLDTFTHRLRQRPIKEKYSKLFELQKEVLDRRLIITSENKSPDWSEIDVIEVLKSLKNGKSRDPLGMCNEIFKPPVAGADLVTSLTIMMNKIKSEVTIPDQLRMKNITAIYKNKGSKSDLENDRGIFRCTVLNTIFQKLIYEDNYDMIDENLSDSNVGARKRKNIRNNSFIINGIINDTVSSKSKTIDLAILDYKQCFVALSVEICTNDMYNVGVTSDHLNLIHESDALSKIAIKTPLGLTKRVDVVKAVAQGEIPSPLKCTVTVDSISEEHTENLSEHLYEYKGTVAIPPLGMVDDQVGISNCGLDSALTTSHLNTQTNIEKLQFGPKKCHKMHIYLHQELH